MFKTGMTRRQFIKLSGIGAITLGGLNYPIPKTFAENEISCRCHLLRCGRHLD